jgi:hypothetical protein
MIISHEHKFVFVSTPKAGTHSMFPFLEKHYGGLRQTGPYHRREVPPKCEDYFIFAVVRNPYNRAVSAWWHLLYRMPYREIWRPIVGAVDFAHFVKWACAWRARHNAWPPNRGNEVLHNQTEWLSVMPRLDAVLHLETLAQDFSRLPFCVGEPIIQRRNSGGKGVEVSDYGRWEDYMTPEAVKMIAMQWAQPDFKRFGYTTAITHQPCSSLR